jgi:dihydroorotate dehydrogenase
VAKKRKSLGRDPFEDLKEKSSSSSVEKMIKNKSHYRTPEAKEVPVNIKLTPSNIKHLDDIRAKLAKRRKGSLSRNDLIRIAITLLSADDI